MGLRTVIACPADTLPLLGEIREERREHFLCLYLNARKQVIYKEIVSIGSLSASIVHPREIMGIDVLDHIIIAEGEFLSMKERALM
jgi:DNA repair protein RadC